MPVRLKIVVPGVAAAAGALAMPLPARATPFGFASNQITDFTIASAAGEWSTSVPVASASVNGTAVFGGLVPSTFSASSTVGAALAPPQIFSGPGPAPPPAFTPPPAGATPPMGTRALANVSAGSPVSGSISLNDGAGGFGNPPGTATSSSTVVSQVQLVGTGQAIQLSFSDLVQQVAATANLPGETSSSQIANVFTISETESSLLLAQFAPSELNQAISSIEGSPARNTSGPTQFTESFTSPNLTAGVSYTLTFRSSATEAIQPASATQVPEPASLALFGLALCGLGYVRRRGAS